MNYSTNNQKLLQRRKMLLDQGGFDSKFGTSSGSQQHAPLGLQNKAQMPSEEVGQSRTLGVAKLGSNQFNNMHGNFTN